MRVLPSMLALALAGAAAVSAQNAPAMATSVYGFPITFEECKERISKALTAEGYTGWRDFGNGWIAQTAQHSASAGCAGSAKPGETVLTIVTAGAGDITAARNRLMDLIVRGVPTVTPPVITPLPGAPFIRMAKTVYAPNEDLVVEYGNFEGSTNVDWIGVFQVTANDRSYQTYQYLNDSVCAKRSGRCRISGPLPAGEYEMRGFFKNEYERRATFRFSVR